MDVVIVGAGKQAEKHARALRRAGAGRILVADSDPARARDLAAALGIEAVDLASLWGERAVQAAVVATPTPAHAETVARCLEAGFHCLCEKPLAMNAREAEALARLARERGRVGMVGYLYRHAPVFVEGRRLFRAAALEPPSGPLGRLVHGWFRLGGRGSHRAWKHRRGEGGGALLEMGVHMLDLLLWYAGDLRDVRLLDRRVLRPRRDIAGAPVAADAEDTVLLRAEDSAGRVFHVACDMLSPGFVQFVELEGEEGTFWGSIEPDRPSYVHALVGDGTYPKGRTPLPVHGDDLYVRQARAFLDALRDPGAPSPAGFDESVALHRFLDRLEESRA